jgi:hypothetical protein
MTGVYPKREPFFANRYVRLLTKVAAANEISPETCWLLAMIVHQEDSCRYRKAITFTNPQMMPIFGAHSPEKLEAARDRAVAHGWLHYEKGWKGVPGRYWVLIPPDYEGVEDAPVTDLSAAISTPKKAAKNPTKAEGISGSYIPTPIPSPSEGPSAEGEVEELIKKAKHQGGCRAARQAIQAALRRVPFAHAKQIVHWYIEHRTSRRLNGADLCDRLKTAEPSQAPDQGWGVDPPPAASHAKESDRLERAHGKALDALPPAEFLKLARHVLKEGSTGWQMLEQMRESSRDESAVRLPLLRHIAAQKPNP